MILKYQFYEMSREGWGRAIILDNKKTHSMSGLFLTTGVKIACVFFKFLKVFFNFALFERLEQK